MKMERVTRRHCNGDVTIVGVEKDDNWIFTYEALEKLAAYEDTELEPSEISDLYANNKKLAVELGRNRAEVFNEQYEVFKKTCDDCKSKKDKQIAALEMALELICKEMMSGIYARDYYSADEIYDEYVKQAEAKLNQDSEV